MSVIWIIVLFILALMVLVIVIYNRLVATNNQVSNAFAQIDVQLKRRYDLVPNLVETARVYMAHEKTTLEAVVEARNKAQSAHQALTQHPKDNQAMSSLMNAEGVLSQTLGRFFALSEAYPDLKANQNMLQLSEELITTENKLAFARQAYNDAVMALNTSIQSFPAVLFARSLGFTQANLLQPIETALERQAPIVKL
ncbi:LemA family protein [Thiolinea disciformis]|uniref:LemA family protein n=1 Tax=Thiolinea disciformis TaxID=125614 RepID=UPI00035DC520|nr:LemA family protein [Thiolinea disciformis]